MDFDEKYKELKKARLNEIINPNSKVTFNFLDKKNYESPKLELANGRFSYISSVTGNRIYLPKCMF